MSIALVIPAYNRADLVAETLHAALAQSMAFSEIVVVDDGSTDHTAAVLAGFGDRIRVIRTANMGVQMARNLGIRSTTAPLVTLCDSDDLLAPGFVRKVLPWLQRHPDVDVLYCNFVLFNEAGVSADKLSAVPNGYFDGARRDEDVWFQIPDLYARNLTAQPLYQCGVTLRRSFFERVGGYDSSFKGVGAEDWEFTLRAIAEGHVAVACEPLARVRRHAGNDSASELHMLHGEVHILQHALSHHRHAIHHETAIRAQVDRRNGMAFNAAYVGGKLELARHLATQLRHKPTDWRSRMKRWISRQPLFVGRRLWRLTQLARLAPKRRHPGPRA